MGVYLFIFLGLIFCGVFHARIKEKRSCVFFYVLVLFLISSFRSSQIGTDYKNYISVFHAKVYTYGKGYNFLSYFASLLGESYVWLGLVVNVVIFGLVWIAYKREVDKKYLLFAVSLWTLNPYCFLQSSTNIMRQGCAMAVVLLAVQFLNGDKKRNLGFLLGIILAGSFHKSAYAFVLLLPFGWIHWKRCYHLVLLSFCAVINLLLSGKQLLEPFAKMLGYEVYLSKYTSSIFDMSLFTILVIGVVLYILYRYPLLYENRKEKWYLDLYLVSLSVLLLLVKNDIAYRMYIYFSFIAPIAISCIVKNLKKNLKGIVENTILKAGYLSYYSALYWLFLVMQMLDHNIYYVPYEFFW